MLHVLLYIKKVMEWVNVYDRMSFDHASNFGRTSSLVEIVDAGVLGMEPGEVVAPMPDDAWESPSPATSWISRARMARSLARS